MHTFSKVLLGLVAVFAIVALVLTSMLYDARNEWLKRVDERQTEVEELTEDLRRQRLVVNNLENEVNRRLMPWGQFWERPPDAIRLADPNRGVLDLRLGMNEGLGLREKSQGKLLPTIHIFGLNEDGTSNYMGAFRVTDVEAELARAQLIRQPYPGEVQLWQASAPAGVRIWESVPSHWRALHADLQALTAEALQAVQDQQARLQTQQMLTEKSQEQLQRRMDELAGDPDPVAGGSQDRVDGLVLALQKEESARNQQLAELDRLRHEYSAKYAELIDLIQRNRNMRDALPQPPAGSENPPVLHVQTTAGTR